MQRSTPAGARTQPRIYAAFASDCKALGLRPGNALDALMLAWLKMSPAEREKAMRIRAEWLSKNR